MSRQRPSSSRHGTKSRQVVEASSELNLSQDCHDVAWEKSPERVVAFLRDEENDNDAFDVPKPKRPRVRTSAKERTGPTAKPTERFLALMDAMETFSSDAVDEAAPDSIPTHQCQPALKLSSLSPVDLSPVERTHTSAGERSSEQLSEPAPIVARASSPSALVEPPSLSISQSSKDSRDRSDVLSSSARGISCTPTFGQQAESMLIVEGESVGYVVHFSKIPSKSLQKSLKYSNSTHSLVTEPLQSSTRVAFSFFVLYALLTPSSLQSRIPTR